MAKSEEKNSQDRSLDPATQSSMADAQDAGIELVWDRLDAQSPQCRFGAEGICCRACAMGPCSISARSERGVCGATADTIVARNFLRMIASGAASHSDHGREVAHTFIRAARGEAPGYEIKDEQKLRQVARLFDLEVEGRDKNELAEEVGKAALREFGKQEGELTLIKRAPERRQRLWRELGVVPRGVDREVVEVMHRTHMGVDQDYQNMMLQGTRAALADGWGGSMLATELQDIMFGTPGQPWPEAERDIPQMEANLGVLSDNEVNIVVHGHEPLLSEMVVVAARDPELLEMARQAGAEGINIAGICCTANEILIRHGVPVAGNFLQQELAISTGAVEMMVVDVQCIMQGLSRVAEDFHTQLVTTSEKARIPGAQHSQFDEEDALNSAKALVKQAIDNFPKRRGVNIPADRGEAVAGFSHEYINYMLGGSFRGSYWPLNSNIIDGRIRGVAGVVGCNNPKVSHDAVHIPLVEELIANDVLVVQTGCSAIASAKAGLMRPETALEKAGDGLREVCEAVGIPPVLHAGSCVDNSRILIALSEMVRVGQDNSRLSLGDDISDLPVAGAAPEWMSEKAIAIGQYFVASGVFTVFGVGMPILGGEEFTKLLFEDYADQLGGSWACEPDPSDMAAVMIDHIDAKRKSLGIEEARERTLFDMEMRRELQEEG